jgi:hypothetical protein
MESGEEPSPADWEELVGNMDEATMERVGKAVEGYSQKA